MLSLSRRKLRLQISTRLEINNTVCKFFMDIEIVHEIFGLKITNITHRNTSLYFHLGHVFTVRCAYAQQTVAIIDVIFFHCLI